MKYKFEISFSIEITNEVKYKLKKHHLKYKAEISSRLEILTKGVDKLREKVLNEKYK